MDVVKTWPISVNEYAREAPGAKALLEKWKNREQESTKKPKLYDDDDVEDEEEDEEDVRWWYEVTVQKKEPQSDALGLRVNFRNAGDWWMTNISPADEECTCAMSCLVDHLANRGD